MRSLLHVLLLLSSTLHAQQWDWAISAGGGSNEDFCQAIATDSQGNVYWGGTVRGSSTFPCATVAPGSTTAGVLAKHAADGTCLWVRTMTVSQFSVRVHGVAIDAEDRIYITGSYRGNADFGDGIVLSGLNGDGIFVARYDADGTCLWARRAGGSSATSEARGIALDDEGRIYISGFAGGTTIQFDDIAIPNPGNFRQVVLASYDSTGTVLWARSSVGNGGDKSGRSIAIVGDRLFVTGMASYNPSSYDGLSLTQAPNSGNLYVLCTDLLGNAIWANSYGTLSNPEGMGIAADTLGNLWVVGRLLGTVELPDATLVSDGNNDDILLMGFAQDGTYRWGYATGSPQRDLAWGVTADGKGNAYVAMQFTNTIDFYGTPVSALGGEDALIAKLRDDGTMVWWSRPSGFQRDIPLCIHRQAVEPHALYFGGYYWGTITYGNSTITHVNNGDAMLVGGLDSTFAVNAYAAPICPGGCDGVAHAFTNGDGPFSYVWSNGATAASIGGLCAGSYTVEVTDANGQVLIDEVTIAEAADPGYAVQLQGDSIWVIGGLAWEWYLNNTQLISDSASALVMMNGDYHALVTDALGCVWSTDTVQVLTTTVIDVVGEGLRAWPNPMGEVLYLDGLRPGELLELRDALGRVMWMGQAPGRRMGIPTKTLLPGSYILRTAEGSVIKLLR